MSIIYAFFMLIMLVFAGLQYNDPDGIYWAIIYLVPAMALGIAAFASHYFSTLVGRILLFLAVIILAFGVYVYWPTELGFWKTEVWWDHEPTKEGMGVAIAYLFTCVTIPLAFRPRGERKQKSKRKSR